MAGRCVLTTGEVAQMCAVAPRTVVMWIDTGILKGRRMIGSEDRRVDYDDLLAFMKEHGMDVLLTYPQHRFVKRKHHVYG